MKAIRCTALFALLVSLAACSSFEDKIVAEGGKRRSGDELREIYGKKVTVNWVSMNDAYLKGTNVYSPDGVVVLESRWMGSADHPTVRDTGKWSIEGDLLCIEPSKGVKSCLANYKTNQNYSYSLSTDGKRGYKFSYSE